MNKRLIVVISREKQNIKVQGSSWEKVQKRKQKKWGDMGADRTFRFYCNNDGQDGGRNEYALKSISSRGPTLSNSGPISCDFQGKFIYQ